MIFEGHTEYHVLCFNFLKLHAQITNQINCTVIALKSSTEKKKKKSPKTPGYVILVNRPFSIPKLAAHEVPQSYFAALIRSILKKDTQENIHHLSFTLKFDLWPDVFIGAIATDPRWPVISESWTMNFHPFGVSVKEKHVSVESSVINDLHSKWSCTSDSGRM